FEFWLRQALGERIWASVSSSCSLMFIDSDPDMGYISLNDAGDKDLRSLHENDLFAVEVKGRAFGSPLARGLYPRASTAEVDPRAMPGAPAAVELFALRFPF
ncbi:MAG: hypothetical protein Q8O91_06245, partial [Candidatus Aminicenantes bacterium]|nr:hypothetical protein [Candidatus Aminicenantes bacterium]